MLMRWPFLVPLVSMTSGLTLSLLTDFYCNVPCLIVVFSCVLFSTLLRQTIIFSICTAFFFFFWGLFALHPWLTPELPPYAVSNQLSDLPVTIEGVISDRPSVSPEGSRLNIRVERIIHEKHAEAVSGFLLLYVSEGDVTLFRGDRIRFISRISVPRLLGLPGEFDYSRYLAFQSISATCRVNSQNEIILIRAAIDDSIQRSIDRMARLLGDSIRHSVTDEKVSSVLTALLIGDQRRIPRELADAYTRAGVNHILSISGFHVGIIAAFITVLAAWLLTRFEYPALNWNVRQIAILIAVPAMVAYLFLTGTAPATARSVIMLIVFAVALFVEREREAINTLLFAAFFLVAINPPTLFDISFQLSFISLWGIIIAVPLIMRCTAAVKTPWLCSLIQFLAASVAASCVTLIPVLFIFKVASLNGIITNFLIVPLLGYGAVLTGFIALPFMLLFPTLSHLLIWPAAALVSISNRFITWCTSLPVFTFHGITPWDMLFFLLFMTSVTFVKRKLALLTLSIGIPIVALVLHSYAATHVDGRLHITMLSVGQAESMLVRLPDGSVLLVDGGGYLHDTGHDFGQRVLAPALGALHIRRIDKMIATHNHPDHSGGLPFVIKNFFVGEFLSITKITDEIQIALNEKNIPRRTIGAGDVITLPGDVVISVLSPPKLSQSMTETDESSVNEQSLVFRLVYGDFSMIFCADAGFEAEERMIDGQYMPKSTVLKVGHHGSRHSTSEEFLSRVKPEIAFISAGAGNRFGLPSTRTIDLLKSKWIKTYRTDQEGTIELVTNGTSWTVSTPYKPE